MTNLLEETKAILDKHGKRLKDVRWAGSADGMYAITWAKFAVIARKTNYDPSYGCQQVARDLVVVGHGWWLERHEHDGAEWWSYKRIPAQCPSPSDMTRVLAVDGGRGRAWRTLDEIAHDDDDGDDDGHHPCDEGVPGAVRADPAV